MLDSGPMRAKIAPPRRDAANFGRLELGRGVAPVVRVRRD
jgi:hypothetical protein